MQIIFWICPEFLAENIPTRCSAYCSWERNYFLPFVKADTTHVTCETTAVWILFMLIIFHLVWISNSKVRVVNSIQKYQKRLLETICLLREWRILVCIWGVTSACRFLRGSHTDEESTWNKWHLLQNSCLRKLFYVEVFNYFQSLFVFMHRISSFSTKKHLTLYFITNVCTLSNFISGWIKSKSKYHRLTYWVLQ